MNPKFVYLHNSVTWVNLAHVVWVRVAEDSTLTVQMTARAPGAERLTVSGADVNCLSAALGYFRTTRLPEQ